MSGFPQRRLRRLRSSPKLRSLVRETQLSVTDLIHPLFVVEDPSAARPIEAMPGINRHTLESLDAEIERIVSRGLRAVMLFGIPTHKDSAGTAAHADANIAAQAVTRINALTDRLAVITDVCLCSYTDHGHCGVVVDGRIDNDATIELLAKTALTHARAGADMVAPSAMMDGMVGAIRTALDASGFHDTAILSYAVKYASSFYGPFREAADCAPRFGDRRSYQMDPANGAEALNEAQLDIDEGADMIMVKPALPYLDVLHRLREAMPAAPLCAYQVSGEYSMIKAAAAKGWIDERSTVIESLTAIKRAGANAIITYFAPDVADWIRG